MTKLNRSIMFALTIMAGFVGGMTSNALFTTQQLHAQTIAYPPLNVPRGGMIFQAADGKTLAHLYADEEGAHFEICNSQGVATVKLNGRGTVQTYDHQGHLKSEVRSDAASFTSYNGAGQAGVTIGSGNIPGSGYLNVDRYGNSQHEISVRYGGETREPIWASP